jgi:ketosteroid isomerase-like protein
MNGTRSWMVLGAFLGALVLASGCQPGGAAKPDAARDEAAIRAVLERIAGDFNGGRIDDMLGRYEDDVLVSAPGQPEIVGKAAWKQGLDQLPKDVPMRLHFDTSELQVSGDLGYERGTYVIEMADQAVMGRHIHIFRRQADGSWKGWRLMENSETSAPLVPSQPAR